MNREESRAPTGNRSGAAIIRRSTQKHHMRDFIAERMRAGRTVADVHREWCETYPGSKISFAAFAGRVTKENMSAAQRADDGFVEIAEALIEKLTAQAFSDPRDVVTWDEDGNAKVTPSNELSPAQASAIKMTVRGSGDDRKVEITYDPEVAARAAEKALRILQGVASNVRTNQKILAALEEVGDRDGLSRFAQGEDPVDILVERYVANYRAAG